MVLVYFLILLSDESSLIDIERLGSVDIGDGHRDEFEPHGLRGARGSRSKEHGAAAAAAMRLGS